MKNAFTDENGDLSMYIKGGLKDLAEIEDPQEYADAASLMNDNSFYPIDELFSDTKSINNNKTLEALRNVSIWQLSRNRYDASAKYHIQIRSSGSVDEPTLAQTLTNIDSSMGRHAWSEGVLSNLPYIINCRSRSVLEAIAKAIEEAGGKTAEISDEDYYTTADLINEQMTQVFLNTNKALYNYYRYHISISSCSHYVQTARELSNVFPELNVYTLRKILRDMLPYTIHCEHHAQAVRAVDVIERNGGKAELESDE